MIDILPLSLLILCIIGLKIKKPINELNVESYLSIENCKSLRGLFAILIIMHHLSQRAGTGILFHVFINPGFLFVSVFFFFSGYGLLKSYINQSEKYKKGFLLKRIVPIIIPYIIISMVYWLGIRFEGKAYSLKIIIQSLINGEPIIASSWFIIYIIFFYIVFWILMVVAKKRYNIMIIGATIWYIISILLCRCLKYGYWWYCSSHLLIVGMIWALNEESILKAIKINYWAILAITILCFTVSYYIQLQKGLPKEITYIALIIMIITSTFFVLGIIILSLKVNIGNKVLNYFGKISLELYLTHGLFIKFFRSSIIYINNDFLWSICVIVFTIGIASILHPMFQFINKKMLHQ